MGGVSLSGTLLLAYTNWEVVVIDEHETGGMLLYILPSGRNFMLAEAYSVLTKFGLVTIPAGFRTDLASIPKIFWAIVSPLERHFPAAVLHDYFYRMPEARYLEGIGSPTYYLKTVTLPLTRDVADEMFLEEMSDLKISWWKRRIMYRAVRVGGNSSWVEDIERVDDDDNE